MHKVIERLTPRLRAIAHRLSPRDLDDLLSEMSLAILNAGPGHKDAYYVRRAKDRACDYFRAECRRARREREGGIGLSPPTRAYLRAACVEVETALMTWTFMTLGVVRSDSDATNEPGRKGDSRTGALQLHGAA